MSLPHPDDFPAAYSHVIEKRLLAWVIDLIATLFLVMIALAATGFLAVFIFPLVWSAVAIAYRYVTINRWGGTLGMMIAALRLRSLDGTKPSETTVLWHSVIYALSMIFVIPQIASVALMLNSTYKQGLNDSLMGTTMVNRLASH